MNGGKIISFIKQYKFVLLVAAAGVALMLLPTGKTEESGEKTTSAQESFSLRETEQRMEDILRHISGVGQLDVMLTLKAGASLELAENSSTRRQSDESEEERDIVTLRRGSSVEDVVVTGQAYPVYQGALVVCEGADSAAVRFAVTEAVSVLTGLGSDKISVVRWQ